MTPKQSDENRPANYTGKWNGKAYYKGRRWFGPSNIIGSKSLRPYTQVPSRSGNTIAGIGPKGK